MAGRFVRASKYRHVFGQSTRREQCYDNLHISNNAWDTNLIKANPKYLSVNWQASGGGAFAVIPLDERGKLPEQTPLFRGHTAPVLDTDWSPFNDSILASGSDDGKVFLWKVPDGFSLRTDAEEPQDVAPVGKLSGHSRKVGHVLFNPAAENILASSSGDYTVKLWDLEDGQSKLTLKHNDIVQSLSWSGDGSMIVTTSRDKKLRFWDVRQQKPAHEVAGHTGAKNSRVAWMGEHDRVVTTGFSKMSDRQLGLWDIRNPTTPVGGDFTYLDSISGVCMPFWDDGCQMLYLAGKGDGNIRYYEFEHDKFEPLAEYKSGDPQRGIAFQPKRGVDTHANEVMRAYKTVNDQWIEPISFVVPRRSEVFQDDIYPPAVGTNAAMSSAEWLGGKTARPAKFSMEDLYEGQPPKDLAEEDLLKSTPTKTASAPARAPAAAPVAKAEPPVEHKSTIAPAASREAPSMKSNQQSISQLADKFADKDAESSSDDEDTSSFEEIPKPVERPAAVQAAKQQDFSRSETPRSQDRTPSSSTPAPTAPCTILGSAKSLIGGAFGGESNRSTSASSSTPADTTSKAESEPQTQATPTESKPTVSSAAGGLKEVLGEIRGMLQAQSRQIDDLTREVAGLKARS
ncbi:Coronin-like protein crn1 [Oleoguttula sp. CCFEE 5521]